ncbi:hypothetical protein NSND_61302 [Nitrospira sp. ND1]|nr:hypothetical protein NSND_61302 [Nitrospira sp. ND1]
MDSSQRRRASRAESANVGTVLPRIHGDGVGCARRVCLQLYVRLPLGLAVCLSQKLRVGLRDLPRQTRGRADVIQTIPGSLLIYLMPEEYDHADHDAARRRETL